MRRLSTNIAMDIKTGLGVIDDDDEPFRRQVDRLEYEHRITDNPNLAPNLQLQRRYTDIGHANIVRICLTGGPCAGKTTAIAEIK